MAISVHQFALPLIVGARDYHDFRPFVETLSALTGQTISYEEIHVDDEQWPDHNQADVSLGGSYYHAVVYAGKMDDHVRSVIAEFKGPDAFEG